MKSLYRYFIDIEILFYRFVLNLYLFLKNLAKTKQKKAVLKKSNHYIFVDFKDSTPCPAIAIYAATIGELRAAHQFIDRLKDKFLNYRLILIPGQSQYTDVFSKVYPEAMVLHEFPSYPSVADQFLKEVHAKLCVFVEGPSLHGFFPIRQDLSLSVACLRHNIPLFVVNACLYEKTIGSTIDQIEHKLFSNLFQESIWQWYVPNQKIEKDFFEHGVPADKLLVTGDIKLDNVFFEPLPPISDDLTELFKFYEDNNCRLIVAGCVNEYDEQVALIKAWLKVRRNYPNVVLVLVPRYINNQVMMDRLYRFLADQGIAYIRRSQGVFALEKDSLLIIDVFGELPYFYEYAEIAFAGRGHGVLEPMKFSKPVVVGPRDAWRKVGSTAYHLFEQFLARNALIECENYEKLCDLFAELLNDREYSQAYIKRYTQFIQEQRGACERIINHICAF